MGPAGQPRGVSGDVNLIWPQEGGLKWPHLGGGKVWWPIGKSSLGEGLVSSRRRRSSRE
jgi:hypothetical protein